MRICQKLNSRRASILLIPLLSMVVASLLYAVCLYRAYGALDTLAPYIYYELLVQSIETNYISHTLIIFHALTTVYR